MLGKRDVIAESSCEISFQKIKIKGRKKKITGKLRKPKIISSDVE
jgi:hypothetical protein